MGKLKLPVVVLTVVIFAAFITLYLLFDPARTEWMPKCPVHLLTGFDCPGCGSQRAIHNLLHGNFIAALRANALMVIMLPLMVVMGFTELCKEKMRGTYEALHRPWLILALIALIVIWTLTRNLISL